MTKAEKLIEEKLSGFKDLYHEEHEDVLSAMEEQSIKFAEWCEKSYEIAMGNEWQHKHYVKGEMDRTFTTSKLYKLFNEL